MALLSESDLLRIMPSFRYLSTAARQEYLEKVNAAADENEKPSDAVNSRGMIEGSDIDDMQATHESMGNGFKLPSGGFATQQDARQQAARVHDPARIMAPEQPQNGGLSGGQAFVRRAMGISSAPAQSPDDRASGNALPNGTFQPGNEDPNDAQFGAAGKSPADDSTTPGGGPQGRNPQWWIRNIPAAGRGLKRS